MHSNVIAGSDLSSSAAFEILIGAVLNRLCCEGALDAIELAKIGQRAENLYFGKPCGLLDQIGASVGGAVAIDFFDPAAPAVQRVDYDFGRSGHSLCIIDSGSTHADLTDDYAGIPAEMGAAAASCGRNVWKLRCAKRRGRCFRSPRRSVINPTAQGNTTDDLCSEGTNGRAKTIHNFFICKHLSSPGTIIPHLAHSFKYLFEV